RQHPLPILTPLPVPKAQFENAFRREITLSLQIALPLPRHPVLETVQFHREPGQRAIEIEAVTTDRMLPTKFEAGEAPGP
ncbi:MAG TPA: hypothetical protein VJA21_13350, partial [Verrucomicrobiae bacterium]